MTQKAIMLFIAIMTAVGQCTLSYAEESTLPSPKDFRVYSRQWRVDMYWEEPAEWSAKSALKFEVQRSRAKTGPFEKCHEGYIGYCAHSDFIGTADQTYFYRVRMVEVAASQKNVKAASIDRSDPHSLVIEEGVEGKEITYRVSPWVVPKSGTSQKLNEETLLTEMQEAGFRYFYDAAHPVSGFPRMQFPGWGRDVSAASAIGMGMFNIVVGVERGFITRDQAAIRILKTTEFLLTKTERFHGAYAHAIDARNGKAIPFSPKDDGADLLETAYLIQGLLFAREYFDGNSYVEKQIREKADIIWQGVEWDWFVRPGRFGSPVLIWHWSPKHEWDLNLQCMGFNECHILYLLALSSPTHGVDDSLYWKGWQHPEYGGKNEQFGVELHLKRIFNISLFPAHYTYMGFDPKALSYDGVTYNEIFKNWCTAQVRYTRSMKDKYKGYGGPLWGLTASANKSGYKAHAPVHNDDGTIAPTAALSSMPYVPKEAKACMMEMFTKHGKRLWGPYGLYDAFNLTQDWYSDRTYLSIDVGPVGPMIENHLTGKCWTVFMKAPEIQKTVKRLTETEQKRK